MADDRELKYKVTLSVDELKKSNKRSKCGNKIAR